MTREQDITTGTAVLADMGCDLRAGERVVELFRPKFISFMQRTLLIGILTTLGFGLVPGLDISFAAQVGLALIVAIVWFFVFDEWQDWRERGRDLWVLTNLRLILINPREEESVSWLNLGDIQSVRLVTWWSVRIKLNNGRVTLMSFVSPVRQVRDQLLRTKAGESDG